MPITTAAGGRWLRSLSLAAAPLLPLACSRTNTVFEGEQPHDLHVRMIVPENFPVGVGTSVQSQS